MGEQDSCLSEVGLGAEAPRIQPGSPWLYLAQCRPGLRAGVCVAWQSSRTGLSQGHARQARLPTTSQTPACARTVWAQGHNPNLERLGWTIGRKERKENHGPC